MRSSRILSLCLLLTIVSIAPNVLHAQNGSLTGRVTDSETGTALGSATVRTVAEARSSRQTGAVTDRSGDYVVRGLAPGRYRVSITYLSYSPFETVVEITAGETKRLNASLRPGSLGLGEVVVSASRQPEKITDAPASVSVVSAREVEEQPAITVIDHIKEIPGIDIVQSGLTQNNVVARGFNNAFSGTLMNLTDNRIAAVPSLRVNIYNFIPLVNEDIQQIEVIRGPGAALYGPNTANGVLHTLTRSPFSSVGTWLSMAGGERDFLQAMVRHAGTLGDRVGYKVSAQYMTATDWPYVDSAEAGARQMAIDNGDTTGEIFERIGVRDPGIERIGGEVRLDLIPIEDMTAILSFGLNRAVRNVDITGVGAGQVKNWQYSYYQARLLYKDFFAQAFLNQSDAGETYLLRTGEPIVDRSTLFVAQAQHSLRPFEELSLTYGVDLLATNPVTDSTITGGNEDNDNTLEVGAYLQGRASIIKDMLEVTAAGRIDFHSQVEDAILSPRVAVVFNPIENHTVRASFNRAYTAPTTNEMFLDIVANRSMLFDVRATGVPESGFSFAYDNGRPIMHSRFLPDGRPLGNDPLLWAGVQQVIRGLAAASPGDSLLQAMGQLVGMLPAPTQEQVGVELRYINPTTGVFETEGQLADRPPVRPTINQSIELGYKGLLSDRLSISVDLYRSHYTDFVGPLETITPNVFYNPAQFATWLEAVLRASGIPEAQARMYAAIGAARVAGVPGDKTNTGIPLATVTPREAVDPTAVMLTYRNYGDITLYGMDLGLRAGIFDRVFLNGSLSVVDRNFFENLDGVSDLALNAPKFKYTLGVEYDSPEIGLHADARVRHVEGFVVRSGVFNGEVKTYTVLDMSAAYDIAAVPNLKLSVTAQNLLTWVAGGEDSPFEQKHAEFANVPEIGRMVMARLTYAIR